MGILLIGITILAAGAAVITAAVFAGQAWRYLSGEAQRELRAALQSDLSPFSAGWHRHP